MALTRLPTELLDMIITHVLPEGFESMALTCRRIYALCTPFIERHNILRSRFRDFMYYQTPSDPSHVFRTAFDLIARIAVEPAVARYIRDADFDVDSRKFFHRTREFPPCVPCDEAMIRLFAGSPYLEQAGLDWREIYAEVNEDLNASHYSQRAATFLLTLMPNVKKLTLPAAWKPLDATDKLIDVIVHKAKQSHLSYNRSSLAQITNFDSSTRFRPSAIFDLSWAIPFLALPHMRSFCGFCCVAINDSLKSITSKDLYCDFGKTLEEVHLGNCCIDEVGMADFLKHTSRLRTLSYSHSTKNGGPQHWNICKFVAAIEREVGSHLVELSISIYEPYGSISPGKASMRGFQRLQTLEFPLELATCNVTAGACQVATPDVSLVGGSTNDQLDYCEPFIGDLVPTSVSRLSLISRGTDYHEKALDLMFGHFAAQKDSQLPALKEIRLSCPDKADNAYKDQCVRLLAETKRTGVSLQLEPFPSPVTWDEGR